MNGYRIHLFLRRGAIAVTAPVLAFGVTLGAGVMAGMPAFAADAGSSLGQRPASAPATGSMPDADSLASDPLASDSISRRIEEIVRERPVGLEGDKAGPVAASGAGEPVARPSAGDPRPVVSFDEFQEMERRIDEEKEAGTAPDAGAGAPGAGNSAYPVDGADEKATRIGRAQGEPGWTDPVIEEAARGAFDTDFIKRQSEFSQSLILLDRQARVGEAIGRLIGIYGPDALIEVAPGEFKSFATLPAARKLRAELDEANFEIESRRMEMESKRREATLEFERRQAEFKREQAELAGPAADGAASPGPVYSLREIFGMAGDLRAVLAPAGTEDRIRVAGGDVLRAGTRVLSIDRGSVLLEHVDGKKERLSLKD